MCRRVSRQCDLIELLSPIQTIIPVVPAGAISRNRFTTSSLSVDLAFKQMQRIWRFVSGSGRSKDARSNDKLSSNRATTWSASDVLN